jgi:hypothetical protein
MVAGIGLEGLWLARSPRLADEEELVDGHAVWSCWAEVRQAALGAHGQAFGHERRAVCVEGEAGLPHCC